MAQFYPFELEQKLFENKVIMDKIYIGKLPTRT